MPDLPLTGGCLCGGVRFELDAIPHVAYYCHCTRCRRRTGAAASPQARIDPTALRWLQGEDLIRGWRHPDGGFEKCFCGECGSHLFSRPGPDDHSAISIRLGAFDDDPGIRPSYHAFVAYAAPWEPLPDDGLERFDEGRPKS